MCLCFVIYVICLVCRGKSFPWRWSDLNPGWEAAAPGPPAMFRAT